MYHALTSKDTKFTSFEFRKQESNPPLFPSELPPTSVPGQRRRHHAGPFAGLHSASPQKRGLFCYSRFTRSEVRDTRGEGLRFVLSFGALLNSFACATHALIQFSSRLSAKPRLPSPPFSLSIISSNTIDHNKSIDCLGQTAAQIIEVSS